MDKEFALILAELLIKQDETTAQMKEVSYRVKDVVSEVKDLTNHVNTLTNAVNDFHTTGKETNNILKDFMSVSTRQWEQQQIFNELMLNELRGIKETLSTVVQLEARLKAVEDRENNFELRLANIEKLLRAS